jgi:two-component system OmpR family response regulator
MQETKTVLVVDDEEAIRDLTGVILESCGYRVVKAADGAVAIEWLRENRPDLITLDLLMPNVDGWGVLEFVRHLPSPPPVVIATGAHDVVPPGQLCRYIAGYLIKPFSVDQLAKICETALASPPVIPPSGARKEARRTYVVKTTLLSETGSPLLQGELVQLSRHGFRLEISIPLAAGDGVRVAFRVPGRPEPLEITGKVRWQNQVSLGAEIENLSAADEELLRQLLED